jgi:hypothetical protein
MAKKRGNRNSITIALVSIIVGLVALILNRSLFDLFFVPIVIGVLWRDADRIGDLQQRLSEMEAKVPKDQPQSSS